MSKGTSDYKHDASDKQLDRAADIHEAASKSADSKNSVGPSHDPAKVARHDDAGKDRLFENREQHDDAEKASERSRLEKDVGKHRHVDDDTPPND